MKKIVIAALLSCGPFLLAQNDALKSLPKDPKAILDLAAPFYVYDADSARPWHLSYHYRLLDNQGKSSSEGRVEFWWSTNKASRITWTKGNSVSSEWHTADGKTLKSVTGSDITGMEHRLSSAVLFSLPKAQDYETGEMRLKLVTLKNSGSETLCVALVSSKTAENFDSNDLHGVGTAYCFDSQAPVLVSTLMNHTITNNYSHIQKFQNHNVAGHIDITYVGEKKLDAELESSTEIKADDAALTPPLDAKEPDQLSKTIVIRSQNLLAEPVLVERVQPDYPLAAKSMQITGTVVIKAVIGKDGHVKNAEIVSSPHPSLSSAALDAVGQWRYKPYLLNGEPIEVPTHINLTFSLGN
jgi:TonB family protein